MTTHTYTLQLHTGSFTMQKYSLEKIIDKIERIMQQIDIGSIILGWNTSESLNQQLVTYFHEKHIQVLLWLPILSETDQ